MTSARVPGSPLRVGLLGYGLSGSRFHGPLIAAEPAFTLAAVASSRTDAVARDWPGVRTGTVESLLADPDLDVLVVCTPNESHASLAGQALRSGKHVVVEKPFALDADEALRLDALAKERGLCLTVFHNRRWDGDFLTVRQLLEKGRLGTLYSLESHFDRFRPQVKDRWKEQDVPGGGTLWDLGSHLVDQAVQLFGLPESVAADLGRQRPGAQGTDWFHLVLRYGALRVVLHSGSVVHAPWPRFVLQGDRDAYVKHALDPQEGQLEAGLRPGHPDFGREPVERHGRLLASGETVATVPGAYGQFYRQLGAAILHGAPVPVTAVSASETVRVIQAALQSDLDGRRIPLPPRD